MLHFEIAGVRQGARVWPSKSNFPALRLIVDVIAVEPKIESIEIDGVHVAVWVVLKKTQPVLHQPSVGSF